MASTSVTPCHALLKRLGANLHACASRLRSHSFFPASCTTPSILLFVLAVLLCSSTALSRVVVFFLPLVVSTSICCAAVYLLVASETSEEEGGAPAKDVVLLHGDRAEVGLLQVYGEANASVYGGRRDFQVGCFLHRRSGAGAGGWTKHSVDEDGEDVVFAGRLVTAAATGQDGAALEEELVALQVDRIAEGVWDSYFGGCARWNYYVTAGPDEEIEQLALLELT